MNRAVVKKMYEYRERMTVSRASFLSEKKQHDEACPPQGKSNMISFLTPLDLKYYEFSSQGQ